MGLIILSALLFSFARAEATPLDDFNKLLKSDTCKIFNEKGAYFGAKPNDINADEIRASVDQVKRKSKEYSETRLFLKTVSSIKTVVELSVYFNKQNTSIELGYLYFTFYNRAYDAGVLSCDSTAIEISNLYLYGESPKVSTGKSECISQLNSFLSSELPAEGVLTNEEAIQQNTCIKALIRLTTDQIFSGV